ncbi:MAG: glycosyltransferase [Sedimentisphaerales bacterium]|nr:glycosyltransferase [Sedimentisphaerales bacterium]
MNNNKIKIARLWSKYEGYVTSRASIILGLDPCSFNTICIYLAKESQAPNPYTQKGIDVFYVSEKKSYAGVNLFRIIKLAKILKEQKIDILHCHRHKATVHGVIAAKLAGVHVIFSHVHGLRRSKRTKRKLINRFILKYVTKILAVGEAVRQDVLKSNLFLSPEKVISLGNSIDIKRFSDTQISKEKARTDLGLGQDCIVFGAVGRLAPTKGFSYLINAFAKTKKSLPKAELIFAGEGRLKTQLQNCAKEQNIEGSVHFLGNQSEMPKVYKAMDVFVLSSIAEGLPRSLLEAMACHIPTVATDVGSVSEILDNGTLGLLIPSEDIDALAKAMIDTSQMPLSKKTELTEKAFIHISKNYSHHVIIKKLQEIYRLEYEKQKHDL